jgi:hypothetical protein
LAATKQSLQESGFPIDATDRDLVFLHSGSKPSIGNLTNHKKTVLTHLKSMFDIHFFFDDTPEFREAAKSLFIPGVYSSISSYTGKEERPSAPKKTKSRKPRSNPAPKPRKKRNKAGNMRKEPIKKYMSRFMADPKMNEEFPDNAQRFAVGLNYAREFYGGSTVDKHYPPRSNPKVTSEWGDKSEAVVLDTNLSSMSYTGNTKLPKRLPYQLIKKLRSLLARDREYVGYVKDNKIYYGTSHGITGVSSRPTKDVKDAEFKFHTHPFGYRKGMQGVVSTADLVVCTSALVMSGVPWEAVIQKRGINFIHTSIIKNSPMDKAESKWHRAKTKESKRKQEELWAKAWDEDIKVIRNIYKGKQRDYFVKEEGMGAPEWNAGTELGQEVFMLKTANHFMKNFKFNMWYLEVPSVHSDWSKEVTEHYPLGDKSFPEVAPYFKGYRQIRSNPRPNPHFPVSEAKEFYKQFHKKSPSSVKKQKIEIGDTWIGLGKAWSIGYRSGKETGNDAQKYIHNFGVDEESGKKFKEPDVYYVKNKDGSQMMVIMGGDWYIDVDADGEVSWIYV